MLWWGSSPLREAQLTLAGRGREPRTSARQWDAGTPVSWMLALAGIGRTRLENGFIEVKRKIFGTGCDYGELIKRNNSTSRKQSADDRPHQAIDQATCCGMRYGR
jgi:hypothetical protein